MYNDFDFSGLGVALITPFTKEMEIDVKALEGIIDNLINNNVDYLVVLGTTAETPTLSDPEKTNLVHYIANYTQGRIPIVVGVGSNNTNATVNDVKKLDAIAGVSGLLLVTPYYNRPSQEGLHNHISAVASVTKLPIILYNIPARCGCNIEPMTMVDLAEKHSNIKAVKEASGSIEQVIKIIRYKPEHFNVISGDDSMIIPFTALGGRGLISVLGNAYPKHVANMVHRAMDNDFQDAAKIFFSVKLMIDAIFAEGNPSGIKCLMNKLGYCNNLLRMPLVTVGDTTERTIVKLAEELSM